jgi:hypothetical protein
MNTFEKIIKDYIESACKTDAVLAGKYEKSGKDIEGCCKYIKSEARKQAKNGCAAIKDDEVFGWAVHYFDEEMTAPKGNVDCKVETTADPNIVRAKVADVPKKAVSLANQKPKAKKGSNDGLMMSLFDFAEE